METSDLPGRVVKRAVNFDTHASALLFPGLPQHGGGLMDWGNRRRSRMRNFNWETLPKHSVIGKHNIWTADKTNGQYELDTDHMEELFSHNNGQPHPKGLNRSSVRGQLPSGSGGEMVTILSSKRSMNIGIFLKQFKRPVKDLIQDIQSGNGLSFGTGKLREMCKLLPDEAEEADVCLEEIETDFEELQTVSDSVSEYFCEDPTTFRLEECCSIFQSFCQKFIRAMQENKAREMAEIKRKHIDRLQSAAKRRSTATCSSRDKEMEGIALEYVLQNVLTDRVSRRRSGKSSSNNGSPTRGSPVNGSLSEISSQKNLPTGTMNHRNTFRENNQFKKEWNSATELTQNFSQKQAQSHVEDNNSKNMATYEEKRKTFKREYFQDLTSQSKATPSPLPTIRSFSATSDDDEEEDLQDNNEEEAQKLREASKKVLQYQNSRGSTSSVDHSLENQKSPPARKTLARQLTFDEETQRYPGDPTDEDLIRFLIGPQSSTKRNLGRRNTLPTNVSKTQGEEENLQPHATAGSPNPLAQIKEPQPGQDVGHTPSKPAFDFTDTSNKIKQSHSLDQSSPSAEKKSKPNGSSGLLSEGGLQENQVQKSMEYTDSHQQTNVENILPRSVWFKTETTGSFFSFLRRLGDISKSPNSKETTPKGSDSSV
ncbi:hypothetical protein GOODEAATRI_007327 [Goodea atripinnis]|uniref:FH2 domain-containing protein n=1 Tax=Goodea atripinnis TaxID=208336 RepID=A0ABV0MG30_9TELE